MIFWKVVNPFVGKSLVSVTNVWLDCNGEGFLHALGFAFGATSLVFRAEADDDTISVHTCTDLEEWMKSQKDAARLLHTLNDQCRCFEGRCLTNIWQCQPKTNYTDAIDLAFGDLVYPNLKVFCVSSELSLMSVSTLGDDHGR